MTASSNTPLTESKLREKVLEILFPFTKINNNDHDNNDDDDDDHDDHDEECPTSPDAARMTSDRSAPVSLRFDSDSQRFKAIEDEDAEGENCAICLEPLDNDCNHNVSGQCPHYYHYACIMNWMKRKHNNCPTCRKDLFDLKTYKEIELIVREQHGMGPTENVTQTNTNSTRRAESNENQNEEMRKIGLFLASLIMVGVTATIIAMSTSGSTEFDASNLSDDYFNFGSDDYYSYGYNQNVTLAPVYDQFGGGAIDWLSGCRWPEFQDCGQSPQFYEINGTIPTTIGLATQLTYLSVLSNGVVGESLTGTIPTEIGLLTNLESLQLTSNLLTGPIPTEFGQLTKLTSLALADNKFTGKIPTELGIVSNITYLDLSINALTGTVPTELAKLTNLLHLYLYSNSLTGTINTETCLQFEKTILTFTNNLRVDCQEVQCDCCTGPYGGSKCTVSP